MRHLCGGAVHFPRQDVAAVAQARGGEGGHAAKLAAADQPDGGIGRQRKVHASSEGAAATILVCSARKASRRSASSGSVSARTEAASRAALTAPERPIAKVPTGMPAGICAIDRRLSMPLSAWLSTGTPNTGRG